MNLLKLPALFACVLLGACDQSNNIVTSAEDGQGQGAQPAMSPGDIANGTPDEDAAAVEPGGLPAIPANVGAATPIVADPSIPALPDGARARAYTGDFNNDFGVFVIDDANRLIGLVEAEDGSRTSVRASIDSSMVPAVAVLSRFNHDQQASVNNAIDSLVTSAFALPDDEQSDAVLDIVDGTQITNIGGDIPYSLRAADTQTLLPVSVQSLQGQWSSNFVLCDSAGNQCSTVSFNLLVDGSTLTGSAGVIASDGTDLLPSALSGSISQRGLVVDVEMLWNTYAYSGFAYVSPSQTSQLTVVMTTDSEIADERMLVLSLVRLQS